MKIIHQAGIIHGNLKTANILVDSNNPIISGFGYAITFKEYKSLRQNDPLIQKILAM